MAAFRRLLYLLLVASLAAAAATVHAASPAAAPFRGISSTGTRQLQAESGLQLVSGTESKQLPLRTIGQLANGCTGFLIGPCHVMTVAHCVYEPWRQIWWRGLDFYPGTNVPPDQPSEGWSPLGTASKKDIVLHPNWTSDTAGSKGRPAADAAIIITSETIGRKLDWMSHRLPNSISKRFSTSASGTGGRMATKDGILPGSALEQLVGAAGVHLQVAGYPDNKPNGSMWWQCCQPLDWQFQGNLLWHDCHVRGGNSGSPVWIEWPASALMHSGGAAELGTSNTLQMGGRKLLEQDSKKRSLQQQQGDQQQGAQDLQQADQQPVLQVVGVHSSSLIFSVSSDHGAYAAAMYADEMLRPPASRSIEGLGVSGLGGQCVAGAGGREAEGDDVLLPVAVPFTEDTYKWILDVLQQHTC